MKAILRKRRHAVLRFVVVGSVVGALVGLLIHQIELGPPLPHALRGTAAGFLIGGILGVGEEFVFIGRYRWRAYMILNALRISLYVTALLAALIIVNAADTWLTQETGFVEAVRLYVVGDTMGRDSIFAIVVAILGTSFLEIRKLHNSGGLRRYLMGVYRYPEAEDRVFLFADLQDSTGLAERLGDLAYTRLIGDCYRDMSEAILAWRGRVEQGPAVRTTPTGSGRNGGIRRTSSVPSSVVASRRRCWPACSWWLWASRCPADPSSPSAWY